MAFLAFQEHGMWSVFFTQAFHEWVFFAEAFQVPSPKTVKKQPFGIPCVRIPCCLDRNFGKLPCIPSSSPQVYVVF